MLHLNVLKKKSLTIIIIYFLFSTCKINAQSFAFNLQTSSLTFDYSTLANFSTPRTITKAFTLSINNSNRGKYNISCKIIPNSSFNVADIPTSIFSVKVNSANFTVNNTYYQVKTIGLSDILVGNVTGRGGKNDTIYYDLILNPVEFDFQPNNYNYSFMFTVSEY